MLTWLHWPRPVHKGMKPFTRCMHNTNPLPILPVYIFISDKWENMISGCFKSALKAPISIWKTKKNKNILKWVILVKPCHLPPPLPHITQIPGKGCSHSLVPRPHPQMSWWVNPGILAHMIVMWPLAYTHAWETVFGWLGLSIELWAKEMDSLYQNPFSGVMDGCGLGTRPVFPQVKTWIQVF